MKLPSHNVLRMSDQQQHESESLVDLATRTLPDIPSMVRRSASSSATTSSSSSDEHYAAYGNSTSLIVGLSVAIPCTAAIILLIILHRRVKRRQALEDANDKHKSLDFGLGDVPGSSATGGAAAAAAAQHKVPEMTVTDMEKSARSQISGKGLSGDYGGNPYLLPASLNGSRESFHSMSRSLQDGEDPYRPVTMVRSDSESLYSAKGPKPSNMSVYTGSSIPSTDAVGASLLKNAQRMSRSDPLTAVSASSPDSTRPPSLSLSPVDTMASAKGNRMSRNLSPQDASYPPPRLGSNQPPLVQISEPQSPSEPPSSPPFQESHPGHRSSMYDTQQSHDLGLDFGPIGESVQVTPPSPVEQVPATSRHISMAALPVIEEPTTSAPERNSLSLESAEQRSGNNKRETLSVEAPGNRRVSMMGLRPLPPDDPSDNPEQRAIRIRSFYKEYFDDSKPNPAGNYPQFNPYAEQYEEEYLHDGAVYDEETGGFIMAGMPPPPAPFAEPMARRAMTPPPRVAHLGGPPPRFRSESKMSMQSMQSTGHINNPAFRGPRPGPHGPHGPAHPPKKPLPPPETLQSLPTPSKLTDDFALHGLDFAPAMTYRDTQLGRAPDTPTGVQRPYSPAVRSATPLVSSYDDLAALPNASAFRNSSTFLGGALDFAPPPKFREDGMGGNASDAGSIRSARSGMSSLQQNAIRQGAYRISRIPKDQVGTTDDMYLALKPKWNLGEY